MFLELQCSFVPVGASGNLWTLHVHLTCQGFCFEVGVEAYACHLSSWKVEVENQNLRPYWTTQRVWGQKGLHETQCQKKKKVCVWASIVFIYWFHCRCLCIWASVVFFYWFHSKCLHIWGSIAFTDSIVSDCVCELPLYLSIDFC